jgi:hypothetical protein
MDPPWHGGSNDTIGDLVRPRRLETSTSPHGGSFHMTDRFVKKLEKGLMGRGMVSPNGVGGLRASEQVMSGV